MIDKNVLIRLVALHHGKFLRLTPLHHLVYEELCKKKSQASVLEHLDLHKMTMKSYDPINRFAGTYSITLDCAETTGTSVQPMPGRQVIIVARSKIVYQLLHLVLQ